MIRLITILLPLIILLMTGCHHVTVQVIPDGADVTIGQDTLRAPADVHVLPFDCDLPLRFCYRVGILSDEALQAAV